MPVFPVIFSIFDNLSLVVVFLAILSKAESRSEYVLKRFNRVVLNGLAFSFLCRLFFLRMEHNRPFDIQGFLGAENHFVSVDVVVQMSRFLDIYELNLL